ncbi:hypothetical protein RD792_014146 [Penstemon davidsonii]|uniref:Glycosyltransferase n=1 Tax=Penstemon davidsonii TaxID=160366 RepID=A0ABR0CP12_9LAMI|nr:hypothetical protein RD792_014146 [Penstemon davidsonii]
MAETKLHAIMIAFSFQGHITPFINLALKLAANGFKITFIHTEFIHQMLSNAHQNVGNDEEESTNFFSKACKSGLDITYKTISDGFSLEYDRILNFNEYWESILRDFPSRVDELIGDIIKSNDSSLVPFLVADTLYSWPSTIAKKYNILNISFWTQPALVFSIAYHLDLLKQNGNFPSKGNDQEEQIDYIPGVGSISSKDLMSYLQDKDTTTIVHQIIYKAFDQVKFADFVLINTINELENGTLLALNENQPTFAIGPINFSNDFTTTIVPKSLCVESDCTEWLNAKPSGSVLYVSFGSLAQSNKELTEEIAHGLLISEVNFIWVLKTDTDVLPNGFKNEIKDRGLIISWCNQNAVLSNSGIGDQPTNRKLVVDDWKIGINLCDGVRVNRDEVAEKIKKIMCIETSKSLRNEIKKLSNVVRSSLDDVGGSTMINFEQFVKDLKAKLYAK